MNGAARWSSSVRVGVSAGVPAAALGLLVASLAPTGVQESAAALSGVRCGAALMPAAVLVPQNQAGAVTVTGSAGFLGAQSPARLTLDAQGRYLLEIGGTIPMTRGFDGREAWVRELADGPRMLRLRELDEARILGEVLSGAWRAPGAFVRAGEAREDGTISFTTEPGRVEGTIELDRATGRVANLSMRSGNDRQTLSFSGWREAMGVWVPSRLSISGSVSTTVELSGEPEAAEARFGPAHSEDSRAGAEFRAGAPAALEVRKARTGHLLVRPTINGTPTGWFIFDTGAGATVIDQATAERLGLEQFGEVPAVGNGGTVTSRFTRPATIELGAMTLKRPFAIVLDFSGIAAAMGEEIAGAIGYDLLHRAVVMIDIEAGAIELHDPAAYAGTHAWSPLMLYERRPVIEAEFEGKRGAFMLDSGAGQMSVSFTADSVERFGLLEGREVRDGMSGGVGGMHPEKRGTVASFTLAGREHRDVPAQFKLPAKEKTADEDRSIVGVIGGGLLRKYRVVLDYAGERIALEPRAAK